MRVERPDDAEGLSHRIASGTIALGSELAIETDDRALFVQHGRVLGALGEGYHLLDPAAIDFLSWAVRPGAHSIDCDLFFVRERGTVDVDGTVHPPSAPGLALFIEASFEVEVPDVTPSLPQLMTGRTLDELLDQQLFRALPSVLDRALALAGAENLDRTAEAVAEVAERDGLGFSALGARFAGFVELLLHETEAQGPAAFAPGAVVLAQASNGRWTEATIASMNAGRIEVAWSDGRREWVTPYQVRPL